MALGGWRSERMMRRYAAVTDETLRRAAEAVARNGHGMVRTGSARVYSDRPRLFAKIWAVPGVRRHQTGDQEMRAISPPEALEQVAGVIRARRQRPAASAAHLQRVV
jgi:hypothetical protein